MGICTESCTIRKEPEVPNSGGNCLNRSKESSHWRRPLALCFLLAAAACALTASVSAANVSGGEFISDKSALSNTLLPVSNRASVVVLVDSSAAGLDTEPLIDCLCG